MRDDNILAEVVVIGFLALCLAGWASMFVLDARNAGRSWVRALSVFVLMLLIMVAFFLAPGIRR